MEPTTSLRDTIESAVTAAEDAAPETSSVVSSEPVPAAIEPAATQAEAGNKEPAGKGRDASGRFAQKEAEAPAQSESAATPAIQAGPKSAPREAPQERAPASWRPDVREHWAQLPAEVRAEVARREQEVQRTLQETSEARKFTDALNRVIQPYEMFIRAENSNPLQAIDNMMATAARLRTAPAPDTAGLIASLVKQFGVGRFGNGFIEQLDSALAGEVPRVDPQQAQLQNAIQAQLAPVQQFMSQFQQAQANQQQRVSQEAQSEVQQFIQAAEFAADVREEMADIMEVAQRRGRDLSLKDAYNQACMTNPRVRSVLEARHKARGAQTMTGAAQKARSAAVSVTGGPSMAPQATPTDVRSAIEAAIAMNSR